DARTLTSTREPVTVVPRSIVAPDQEHPTASAEVVPHLGAEAIHIARVARHDTGAVPAAPKIVFAAPSSPRRPISLRAALVAVMIVVAVLFVVIESSTTGAS